MTHILVKSGRVIVQGGRVLTSQGGAPCCCGPGEDACWLVVLACNCRNLRSARVLALDSPGLETAWPYQDRRSGVVVSIGGVCYQFMAATTIYPTGLDPIDWADFDGITYESCSESPCNTQPPCDCDLGFAWSLSNGIYPPGIGFECLQSFDVCGIERIDASFSRSFYRVDEDVDDNEIHERLITVAASGVIEEVNNGPQVVSIEGSGRTSGRNTFFGRDWEWDISQTYTNDDLTRSSVLSGFINSVNRPSPGAFMLYEESGPPGATFGQGWPQSLGGMVLCCCTVRDGSDGANSYTLVSHSSASMTLTGFRVNAFYERESFFLGDPRERAKIQVSVSASLRYTLVGGIVIEDEDCDRPPPSIAIACSPEAIPQQITYDPLDVPAWANTIRRPESEELYIPTGIVSDDEPVQVFSLDETCPEPPNPTGDIYWIRGCRGSSLITEVPVPQGEQQPPVFKTVGYRPGPGMSPGEGHVRIGELGQGGCVWSVGAQPTTEVMDTEPEVILESRPVSCLRVPSTLVDPRPACRDKDAGGGVGPSDINLTAPVDPALQAEIDRQEMMRTGQRPGGCSQCGG